MIMIIIIKNQEKKNHKQTKQKSKAKKQSKKVNRKKVNKKLDPTTKSFGTYQNKLNAPR